MKLRNSNTGFTLIELMLVAIIVAVLLSIVRFVQLLLETDKSTTQTYFEQFPVFLGRTYWEAGICE